ncbi:MAG: 16S rRNA (guanine(966)-N(2))-methyltransferase RsmD [Spirochaeta sp.]|nr:16S rRNA (guanine(966)-N(2))-methyltransferase RsmD [Spirochaeta sp.]RPG13367.1 MAG: 16S rRNA (guanine(966)-N(2))-methyltransferase RsmD [Proteobacteria bacterium TMED72]
MRRGDHRKAVVIRGVLGFESRYFSSEKILRIVAGTFRGRKLASPPEGVRPTSDRVRESLFSRLGDLSGSIVLDLFAGTGALGLESISRGATELVCVDQAAGSIATIKKNADRLGLGTEIQCIRAPAHTAIRRLHSEGRHFDLVFLDPPYADVELVPGTLEQLLECDLLSPGAPVVVEGPRNPALELPVKGFEVEEARRYGDTVVTWFYAADD